MEEKRSERPIMKLASLEAIFKALNDGGVRYRSTCFADEPFAFEEEYVKALVKPLHGAIAARFVCIETLIRMKEASDRLADRADAEQLRLTLKADEPADLPPGEIDWYLTTWEGSRQKQLRDWATLPLERAVEGLEGMEELFERFREMRETSEFTSAAGGTAQTQAAPSIHEPQLSYEDRDK